MNIVCVYFFLVSLTLTFKKTNFSEKALESFTLTFIDLFHLMSNGSRSAICCWERTLIFHQALKILNYIAELHRNNGVEINQRQFPLIYVFTHLVNYKYFNSNYILHTLIEEKYIGDSYSKNYIFM